MKIDKSNPLHWLYLVIFSLNTCLVLLLRIVWRRSHNTVILYGHKLNGNLKAIQAHASRVEQGPRLYFLTMDPAYFGVLRREGHLALLGLNPLHMLHLVSAYALISDHGLHSLILLLKFSRMKFVDVWHGIPFKGFDANDFVVQHRYDEVWVASERLKTLYVERFGFRDDVLKLTGYARTDMLVKKDINCQKIKEKLGIGHLDKKVILFAPTWQQDQENRNIFPFAIEEGVFLRQLEEFCREKDVVCILRKHLNTRTKTLSNHPHIYHRPYEDFPDAEEVLLISDILICDWSSIAFDYLLLDRPTLFLDVPPPFKNGLALDASYRFGQVIRNIDEMFSALAAYLADAAVYHRDLAASQQTIKQAIYGEMADGHAAERCYARLLDLRNLLP